MTYAPEIRRCGHTSVVACIPNDWTDQQVLDHVKEEAWGRSNWRVRDSERPKCSTRQGFSHVLVDYDLKE